MIGRPSDFTQEIADAICEKIADGQSLRSICLAEDMPNKATVFRWLANPAFHDQYAHARETQADSLADDITDIADDDKLEPNDKRVRIDARKWLAGKMRPKKYGEAIQMKHTDGEGGPVKMDLGQIDDGKLDQLEDQVRAVFDLLSTVAGSDPGGES